jgi:hypothetical protein
MLAAWGLLGAAPVVVLVGGAGAMDAAARDSAVHAIRTSIIPVATAAGATVLTGGTDAGVMRLAGEARQAAGATFPLVGVVPAGLVDLPAGTPAPGSPTSPAPPTGSGTRVQPDHTHVLAVPGERWGEETPWLFAAADAIAGARGAVTVVLNGGAIAREEIAESVRRGRPVIVVDGTGRTADEIADALADGRPAGEGHPEGELRESGLVQAVRFDEDEALRDALRRALAHQHGSTRMSHTAPPPARDVRPTSFDDEMGELIDRLEVTEEQRRFLRSRWLGQVAYMGDRASEAKRRYYRFRLATVIGGLIVPTLVSISLVGSGRFNSDLDFMIRVVMFVVSAIVAVTASVEGFFRFGDRWRHYRVNAELLKSEGWQYLTRSGGYRRIKDPDAVFHAFADRVEEILRDDVEGFMTQVARTSPVEKRDIVPL